MSDDAPKTSLSETNLDKLAVKLEDLQARRVSKSKLAAMADAHEANPWLAAFVGLAMMGFAGWLIVKFPPASKIDGAWKIGIGLLGFFALPGVAKTTLANLSPAVDLYRKIRGTSGPAGPTSSGNP